MDVSRIRFQEGGGGTAPQDELDLDAAVVPLRHLGAALQRMEMEAGAGAIGEKARSSVSINSIFLSYALSLVIPARVNLQDVPY